MEELYNIIVEKIQADLPEIKWIDFDFGQLEQYEQPPVLFPCALITIGYPNSEPTGKADRITAEVSIKLGFDVRIQTNGTAPIQTREMGTRYLKTFGIALKKFRNFKPDGHSKFQLASAQPQMLPNSVRTITPTFTTRFTESGT
jgi:hypothetical protein